MRVALCVAALAMAVSGSAMAADGKYDGDYTFSTWAVSPESFCQPRPSSGLATVKGGTVASPQVAHFVINGSIKDDGWVELQVRGGASGAPARLDGKFKTANKAEGLWAQGPCSGVWMLERKK